MPDFRGAEGVQIDFRVAILQIAEQLFIPFQSQRRMIATLKEDLIATQSDRFFDFLVKLFARKKIGVRIVDFAVKSTEVANGRADVAVVDVAVDVVSAIRLGMQST